MISRNFSNWLLIGDGESFQMRRRRFSLDFLPRKASKCVVIGVFLMISRNFLNWLLISDEGKLLRKCGGVVFLLIFCFESFQMRRHRRLSYDFT